MAIAVYCLFQSSSTASAIAVYLHQPVQYICVATCSTTAPGFRFLGLSLSLLLGTIIGPRILVFLRFGTKAFTP